MLAAQVKQVLIGCSVLVILVAISAAAHSMQQHHELIARVDAMTHGNADDGVGIIKRTGCGGCHVIPGIQGATGQVGPPLTSFSRRIYIGGVLSNTAEHLQQWLKDPPAIDEKTAMPNVGLSDQEARDVAAYLYTLQ